MKTTYTFFISIILLSTLACKKELPAGPTTMFTVGKAYGGGVIIFIDSTGQHGLISSTIDQDSANWGCEGTYIDLTQQAFGYGQANTTAILIGCNEPGIAARIANDWEYNGYNDWFLPSLDEIDLMIQKKNEIGGFSLGFYWTSSEFDDNRAFAYHSNYMNTGYGMQELDKSSVCRVRCIRKF